MSLPARRFDRRTFLASAAAAGGALLWPGGPLAQGPRGGFPLARGVRFTQGVASGQPTPEGITLWTRLPDLERSARLQVEISRDADFRSVIYRQDVVADASKGFAVHHRVEDPRVVRPGEQCFFRFATCDESSRVGRFRLAPPPDSAEPVRVGFFSCQKYHQGYYTAHQGLAAEDLDLVVCLGDYIYEEVGRNQKVPSRRDTVGADGNGEIHTLEEFRAKYALYQSDPDLQALHASAPFMAIWDDHEVENDYAGATPGDAVNRRVPFEERKTNGYRAWRENLPILAAPGRDRVIYGSVPLGRHAEVLLLDERQYRDPLLCEPVRPCPQAVAEPPRTLLGAEQKAWLKGALRSSRATWKLVANQVMAMALDLPTGVPINADQWDGYAAERREILSDALAGGVRDVAFVTGDIHTFFAGTVTVSGRVGSAPAATEFVAGSITSEGIAEEFGDQAIATDRIREINPHIAYADTLRRGYGVVEARADELRVDFRGPESVLVPSSPIRTWASFKVASGSTTVERA